MMDSDLEFPETTFTRPEPVKEVLVERTDTPYHLARYWHDKMTEAGVPPPCPWEAGTPPAVDILAKFGARLARMKVDQLVERAQRRGGWISLWRLL